MAGFSSTGPLDLPTIGQAVGDTAPHSLSEYYNISFTDGSSTPSAGPISIGNFLGKTIGFGAGAPWTQQGKLISPNASQYDYFGYSVAISGDYAVIGAYREDPVIQSTGAYGPGYYSQADGGAAYVYKRATSTTAYYTQGNWYFQARLTPTDLEPYDNFGISVAIDGDYVIVGARGEDPGNISSAGSAYIFVRSQTGSWPHPVYGSTWAQQTKLTGSPTGQNYFFGDTVAIDGLTAVVGAPRENQSAALSLTGAVYVFVRSGTSWSQQAKLTASDSDKQTYDNFGSDVAIDGSRVVIGARSDDEGGSEAGATYVFVRSLSSWTRTKLINSDAAANDRTGFSVSLSGNTLVTGAYFHTSTSTYQTDQGAAYIYTI